MIGRFFRASFYTFSGSRDTTLRKSTPWSFLFSCLFKLSKREKAPSFSFVRLVKTEWHRALSKWRPPSICYPRQACHPKIIGVLARNGGGNKGTVIVVIGSMSLLNMALFAFVSGWGHLILFYTCLRGFGLSCLTIHLLIALSPWPLISWCQILPSPLSCRQYVQEKLTSAEYLTSLWYLTQNILSFSVSCRWCGKHYGPPSIKITSCRLHLIIQEDDL